MRKNAITNPINHVLQTRYGLTVPQLSKFRTECVQAVSQLKTNRGSSSIISDLLEEKFPGFEKNFPIPNWEQREPRGKKYDMVRVSKDFISSLNAYVKSINVEVSSSYGKKARRSEAKLCQHFNIDPVQPASTVNLDNETIQILDYALSKGAKLFRKGDLEIQF
jgi:hypothetical protein